MWCRHSFGVVPVLLAALVWGAPAAFGQCGSLASPSTSWMLAGAGDFGIASNWNNGVPNGSTNACIVNGVVGKPSIVNVGSAAAQVLNLQINAENALNVGNGAALGMFGSFANNGAMNIFSGGAMNVNASAGFSATNVATVLITGSLNFSDNGLGNGASILGGGTINLIGGSITGTPDMTLTTDNAIVGNGLIIGPQFITTGSITPVGHLTIAPNANGFTDDGTVTITRGNTLSILGSGASASTAIGSLQNGLMTISGGRFNDQGAVTLGSCCSFSGTAATGTVNILNGGTAHSVGLDVNYGSVTISGSGSRWIDSGPLIGAGNLTVQDGGSLISVGGQLSQGNTVLINGRGSKWVDAGGSPLTAFMSVIKLENGGVVSTTGGALDVVDALLEVGSGSALYTGGGAVENHADGNVEILPGGTLDTGGGAYTAAYDFHSPIVTGVYGTLDAGAYTEEEGITLVSGRLNAQSYSTRYCSNMFDTSCGHAGYGLYSPGVTVFSGGVVSISGNYTDDLYYTYIEAGGAISADEFLVNGITVDGTLYSHRVDAGVLAGTGTIVADLTSAAVIFPGSSSTDFPCPFTYTSSNPYCAIEPGLLTVNGSATLATFIEEIAGLNNFGMLLVNGEAVLGGTLDIELSGGYTPSIGDAFLFIDPQSVIGTFGTIEGESINSAEEFQVIYGPKSVELCVVSTANPVCTAAPPAFPTPEPRSLMLLSTAVPAALWYARRRRKTSGLLRMRPFRRRRSDRRAHVQWRPEKVKGGPGT